VLVLAALTLVTIDARSGGTGVTNDVRAKFHDAFAPLERATHSVLRPIGDFFTGALDYGSLRQENQRLRDQLAGLESQSIQTRAEQSAAQQLFALQKLPFVGSIPSVSVAVIDNGSSNFENTLTVNKGTSSGLAVGQPVVAGGGLVGRVEQVGTRTATVLLLTDPTFAVGVRLGGANVGTAQGTGPGEPLRVSVDTTGQAPPKLVKGQAVLTSGLHLEKFPPNIPVGKVASFTREPGAAEPDITLTPFTDPGQLAFAQVLLWASP
jgi:rod shape-determining protein MreC